MTEERKDEVFQIPAEMVKAETRRNDAVKFVFETQENITEEMLKRIFSWRNKIGWLVFAIQKIQPSDLLELPKVNLAKEKQTPSQRLRSALYILYNQKNDGFENFDMFYEYHIEKFRQHILSKVSEEI